MWQGLVYNHQSLMNQIVYQPQNDTDKRDNSFRLSSDHLKHLNSLMPVGYIIISKNKSSSLPTKKKEVFHTQQTTYPVHYPTNKYQPPAPVYQPPSILKKLTPEMTRCMRILQSLKSHPSSAVFMEPVDTSVIVDYLDYVSQPIDLGSIQYNVQNGVYQTFTQFMVDIKKMWYNAYSYNPKDTLIYNLTIQMDKYFDKLLKDENVPIPTLEVLPPPPVRQNSTLPRPQPKKKISQAVISQVPLSMQQKRSIVSLIKKMPHQYLRGVWNIMSNNNDQEQIIQFDIQTMPTRKARQLQLYVKKSFSEIDAKNKQNPSYDSRAIENQLSENESSFMIDEDDSN